MIYFHFSILMPILCTMYHDNIIYLPGKPRRYAVIRSNPVERVTLMSTYEEFMVILTAALLIVAILNYKK